eukprot:gene2770-1755_t
MCYFYLSVVCSFSVVSVCGLAVMLVNFDATGIFSLLTAITFASNSVFILFVIFDITVAIDLFIFIWIVLALVNLIYVMGSALGYQKFACCFYYIELNLSNYGFYLFCVGQSYYESFSGYLSACCGGLAYTDVIRVIYVFANTYFAL